MPVIKPQAARERFARHVRGCESCNARTGVLCTTGELLARRVALAVIRRGGRKGGAR